MNDGVDVRDGADTFIAKWRARWPEWELARVFVPEPQRRLAEAWFTLLQELADAAWAGADPTPGLAKLAWWQEELAGWSKGARRHPLGVVLQPQAAPWQALGRALPDLRALRGDGEAAVVAAASRVVPGEGFAAVVAACEAALFQGRDDAAARAEVLRSLHGERDLLQALPMAAIGSVNHGGGGARPGSRPRGIAGALLDARQRRPERALAPLRALLVAWRGARAAR